MVAFAPNEVVAYEEEADVLARVYRSMYAARPQRKLRIADQYTIMHMTKANVPDRTAADRLALNHRLREAFDLAYGTWVDRLERESWRGVPEAPSSGDELFQELVLQLRARAPGVDKMAEERPAAPDITAVSEAELRSAFSGPAIYINKIYATGLGVNVRLAFMEQLGETVAPQFRVAVVMSTADALALRDLLSW